MKNKLVSLYSGCGGLDLGLEKAGFTTVYANDLEPLCELTFANNFKSAKYFNGDVEEYLDFLRTNKISGDKNLSDVALVAGGPPCPPFSKSRFYRKDAPRALADPKAEKTVSTFFDIVGLIDPKMFLLENVPGITFKSHQSAFDYIIQRTKDFGYTPHWKILNAADYGVPQMRKRFFLVGTKNSEFEFPKATHSKEIDERNLKPWVGCGVVLNELDTDENSSDEGHVAGGKHNNLLKEIPPGDNYLYFTEKEVTMILNLNGDLDIGRSCLNFLQNCLHGLFKLEDQIIWGHFIGKIGF